MFMYYKTDVPFDYFVRDKNKFYYMNYTVVNAFDEIRVDMFEYVPKECLPKVLIPIDRKEIENAKPEHEGYSIEDTCSFVGSMVYRNRISVLKYRAICFMMSDYDLLFKSKILEALIHKSGRLEIYRQDELENKKKYSAHIKYDDVSKLFLQMENLVNNTGTYNQYVDDISGSITFYYENRKIINLPRGIEDVHGNNIHFVVMDFLRKHNIGLKFI